MNDATLVTICFDGVTRSTRITHEADRSIFVDLGGGTGAENEQSALSVIRVAPDASAAQVLQAACELAAPETDVVIVCDLIQPSPACVEQLLETLRTTPHAGVVSSRISRDGTLLHAGVACQPGISRPEPVGRGEKDIGQYGRVREVDSALILCSTLRRDVLPLIPFLTERGWLDISVELSEIARAYGLRTLVNGNARAELREGADGLFMDGSRSNRTWKRIAWLAQVETSIARSVRRALERRFAVSDTVTDESCDLSIHVDSPPVRERRPSVWLGTTEASIRSAAGNFDAVDEIWVTNPHHAELARQLAAGATVVTVAPAVEIDHLHPGIRAHMKGDGEFVFLTVVTEDSIDRSTPVIKAFNDEFSCREPAALVVSAQGDPKRVAGWLTEAGLENEGGRILLLLNRRFPDYQRGSLFRSVDCYVSNSPEVDLLALEVAACATPVMVPAWPGTEQLFNHLSWTVRSTERVSELRKSLREAYENPDLGRCHADVAAETIVRQWSDVRTLDTVESRLRALTK